MNKKYENGLIIIALSKAFKEIHNDSLELFREYGITLGQFAVLEALNTKGPITIQEIIDVILATSGNMTVLIKNLEKSKLVKKKVNPKDKRSYLVSLTPKGEELIKEVFPKHMEIISKKLEVYSPEEKKNLLELLKRLY